MRAGEDVSEMLEYAAIGLCKLLQRVGQLARGLAGPGLLAHVLVSKYADHLPAMRDLRAARNRTERSTLANRARPLLQSLHDWFEVSLTKLSRKSDTTEAIRYALKLWPALTRYCDDDRLEIDNNAAERALRAVTLGRKNYLFAGSDVGGKSASPVTIQNTLDRDDADRGD